MAFFDSQLMHNFSQDDADATGALIEKLLWLHGELHEQLITNKLDLHLLSSRDETVRRITVADPDDDNCLSVNYLRQRMQAVTVERLMGREEIASTQTVEARRHPVIELRLCPDYFVIELLISRDAWWDQQNLVGKLGISRHKQQFYAQLRELDDEYVLGFWKGVHLSEMSLSAKYFHHTRIMDEWISTFQPGADWFRIGIWYPLDHDDDDDPLADEQTILATAYTQVRTLYAIYQHLCWSSNNNFRDFYLEKR